MKNNDRNTWYAPLSAQFQLIEEAMPLSRFAAIEAVLYLLSLTAPDADPTKAYEILGWKAEKNLEDMCRDSWNWQSHNINGYE